MQFWTLGISLIVKWAISCVSSAYVVAQEVFFDELRQILSIGDDP